MKVLTCAVCGLGLGSDDVRKCRECGHYVCRDHIRYVSQRGWLCTTCARSYEKKERSLILNVAYIDL